MTPIPSAQTSGHIPHGAGLEMLGPGDLWYKDAIIYALSVESFQDSNGDGIGDFPGLTGRLDYLDALGVTCIWLQPFYPSPLRDHGYDVTDYYGVHRSLGTLGDFVDFLRVARGRGIRVIVDLVVNHTSDQHPWFEAARRDPASSYRDYYIWADAAPSNADDGMMFPGVETSTWTRDDVAGAFYFHRFYRHQPDLNLANPAVREEIRKIMGFWLELGVSGFRIDAAPFLIDRKGVSRERDARRPHTFFRYMRNLLSWRRGDAMLLAEANVEMSDIAEYVGTGDKLHMLFNFPVNQHYFLALATERAAPLTSTIAELSRLPDIAQWATFARSHDELDLGRLTADERAAVYASFAPDPSMRLYHRGIRRRLASMLDGSRERFEMAHALFLALVGTPVLYYGEEIGMGDQLDLPERDAVRTPMQWTSGVNGGFSDAPSDRLVRAMVTAAAFAPEAVNVAAQQKDGHSRLNWMRRAIGVRKTTPELSRGRMAIVDTGNDSVVGLRAEWRGTTLLTLHNLSAATAHLPPLSQLMGTAGDQYVEMLADREYATDVSGPGATELGPYGFRWIRSDARATSHRAGE